jgi:DNA repair protein RadC
MEENMPKIKDLPKIDRPREKLEKYGPERLSDSELLAILLGSGVKGKNVLILSREILRQIESIGSANISRDDFKKIHGLGRAKISQILALIELSGRLNEKRGIMIESPEDIWKLCVDFYDSKKEHLAVFYLDTKNRIIERRIISIGTLNSSLVHPREIFEPALSLSASSVMIAHNHPSGSLEPSAEDRKITWQLLEAANILGFRLLGHVIITQSGFKEVTLRAYEK